MRHKVKDAVKDVFEEHLVKDECCHYWILEMANGPTSKGVCKFCGAEREFLNSLPDFTVLKRRTSVLELPELPDVEFDEEQNSS